MGIRSSRSLIVGALFSSRSGMAWAPERRYSALVRGCTGRCNRAPAGRIDHQMGSSTPPSIDADRVLVAAVLAGAPGAFEALVRAHERLCWHIINRMVRHP